MQWPPTSPGLSFMKFHFEEAASGRSVLSGGAVSVPAGYPSNLYHFVRHSHQRGVCHSADVFLRRDLKYDLPVGPRHSGRHAGG